MNQIRNLSKDKYTLKPKSTETISFMGARPNHYRITNSGGTPLYLGVSMMPTEDFYDMKIPPSTTKLFVDAYGHDEIYIYNPSEYDHNIIITSFTDEFNATALALSDMGIDFADVTLSGEFDATGDLKKTLTNIYKALGNSTNESYASKTVNALSEVKAVNETMSDNIVSVANKIKTNGDNNNLNLSYIIELLQGLQNPETATYNVQGFKKDFFVGESETYIVTAPENHYFNRICQIIANDDIQMHLRKAKGSNYNDLTYLKANMDNGFNCQYHQLEFINSGAERIPITVIAEVKPYRKVMGRIKTKVISANVEILDIGIDNTTLSEYMEQNGYDSYTLDLYFLKLDETGDNVDEINITELKPFTDDNYTYQFNYSVSCIYLHKNGGDDFMFDGTEHEFSLIIEGEKYVV